MGEVKNEIIQGVFETLTEPDEQPVIDDDGIQRDEHGRPVLLKDGIRYLQCERCGSLHREYLLPFPLLAEPKAEPRVAYFCKKCTRGLGGDLERAFKARGFLAGLAKMLLGRVLGKL